MTLWLLILVHLVLIALFLGVVIRLVGFAQLLPELDDGLPPGLIGEEEDDPR